MALEDPVTNSQMLLRATFSEKLRDIYPCLNLLASILGSPGSVQGPLLKSLSSVIHSHGFSYHGYADDTQLILSFPRSRTKVAAQISACLADISQRRSAHHLKPNLDETELFFLPGKSAPVHDLFINTRNLWCPRLSQKGAWM